MSAVEVVVARYRESVAWTRTLPAAVALTIYDKGGDLDPARIPRARVVRLENVGREAHTYIHHILVGEIAPLTVFCQGHPFDHAPDMKRVIAALADGSLAVPDFRWLGFIIDTDDACGGRLFRRWSKNEDGRALALDRFHRELLGAPAPPWVRFYPGGQMVVAAARVATRTRAFWQRALALAESFPDAAHCYERLWDRVFGVSGVDPALLGDAPCCYLKPVRKAVPVR